MQNPLAFRNITGNEIRPTETGYREASFNFYENKKTEVVAPLSIRYRPVSRHVEAVWQRQVSSEEYRQGIRFLGMCIAILKPEYMLVDFTYMGNPTAEEQQSTSDFLQKALKNTTLLRSARVLAKNESQQRVYEAIVKDSPPLPYEVRVFYSVAKAKEWLFQQPFKRSGQPETNMLIPLHCSLKELKKYAQAGPGLLPAIKESQRKDPTAISRCSTDFMEITIDKSAKLMRLHWLRRVTSREYRYGILKACRALIHNSIESVLVQNQRLGVLTLEDQAWVVSTCILMFSKSKINLMAVVSSADVMQQMASEKMNSRLKNTPLPLQTKYFLAEAEAMEWLQTPNTEQE